MPMTNQGTKEWRRVCARSKKWREENDCTVKALAIATNSTYEKAHGALALRGRNYRKGLPMEKVFSALHEWGYTVKTEYKKSDIDRAERWEEYGWDIPEELGEKVKKMTRSRWSKGKTIRSITPHLPSRGVFLIETRAHVLCVRAGQVHDWTDGRRHRITHVHRIIKEAKRDD
jgi:hypothetical protein